ncbi:MAG: biotin carboxylase N-terminal domain-containing protein, partial [Nakamurella sp.]
MITSLLIANRGEIARRIIRTAKAQGIRSVAVHSDIDADLPFVAEADHSVQLPGAGATAYRDIDAILKIA